jgi:hypothetical protein
MTRVLLTLLLAFICGPCGKGGTLAAEAITAERGRLSPVAASRIRRDRLRVAAGLHATCRGGTFCDCQHREPPR